MDYISHNSSGVPLKSHTRRRRKRRGFAQQASIFSHCNGFSSTKPAAERRESTRPSADRSVLSRQQSRVFNVSLKYKVMKFNSSKLILTNYLSLERFYNQKLFQKEVCNKTMQQNSKSHSDFYYEIKISVQSCKNQWKPWLFSMCSKQNIYCSISSEKKSKKIDRFSIYGATSLTTWFV